MAKVCAGVTTLIFALIFIAGGGCLYKLLPPYVKKELHAALVVDSPTASSFDTFANSSSKTSIYQSFYVFHCNNPYDVVFHGAIPSITQKGPYNYLTTQWRDLDNISWYANATIQYTYHETYTFEPSLSQGNLETDTITTLNLGLIGALYEKRSNPIEVALLKDFVGTNNIFVNITVSQLLWGYNNTFLESLWFLGITNAWVSLFTQDDPSSWSAPSAMYTGGKAASEIKHQPPPNSQGQMTMWEGMTQLPYWGSTYANMINGTDGTCLPPGVTSSDSPYVFVDTLYRSVRLSFQETTSYEDVDLLRFVLSQQDTLSQTENPDNAAFGMTETGFLPTPPAGNAPLTFSKPHYLDADLTNVKLNITPASIDRDLYETYLDAEPTTGLLFRVHKRIQLNAFLQPWYNTSSPNQVSTWYPILWADENMELPSSLVDDFKKEVKLPLDIATYGGIVAMAFGGLLVLISFVLFVFCKSGSSSDLHRAIYHTPSEIYAEKLNSS